MMFLERNIRDSNIQAASIKYKCVDDDTNYYGTVFYDLTAEKVTE